MKLETFFEKFDLFADAPDAVEKMRELICQLAVQGRLVQQDGAEESANVLLKQIREARAALSANRRSSDEPDTTELEEESLPFAAPSGWTWTSLGTVQVFTNGYAFKSEDYESSGVGIIRMGELGANGEIDERNMKYVSENIAQSLPDTFRVKPGDLLMGMSGSIGKLAINRSNKTYLLNQRVGRLEPILIEKAFLHVFLKTVEQHYLRISFGMAIKNLSTRQINETPFPLPPLAEQKRIVAKVDELMALCDRLEAQQQERETRHAALARASLARFADAPTPANLPFLFHPSYTIPPADLRQSILTLAVQGKLVPQDPSDEPAEELCAADEEIAAASSFDVPNGWIWTRHSNLAEINGGFAFKSTAYTDEGTRVVRISDFDEFGFKDHKVVRHPFTSDLQKFTLAEFNILMAMTGGTVGKSYFVRTLPEPMVVNQRVATIKVFETAAPSYIDIVIRSEMTQEVIRKAKNSTNDNISMGDIKGFAIPLPPLAEQRRIVAKVDELMALVDALETQLATARTTAASLLTAAVAELTNEKEAHAPAEV